MCSPSLPGKCITSRDTVSCGVGQVLLGGALCSAVAGCVFGTPVATLGASNIHKKALQVKMVLRETGEVELLILITVREWGGSSMGL